MVPSTEQDLSTIGGAGRGGAGACTARVDTQAVRLQSHVGHGTNTCTPRPALTCTPAHQWVNMHSQTCTYGQAHLITCRNAGTQTYTQPRTLRHPSHDHNLQPPVRGHFCSNRPVPDQNNNNSSPSPLLLPLPLSSLEILQPRSPKTEVPAQRLPLRGSSGQAPWVTKGKAHPVLSVP